MIAILVSGVADCVEYVLLGFEFRHSDGKNYIRFDERQRILFRRLF